MRQASNLPALSRVGLTPCSCCVTSELKGAYAYGLAGTMVWEIWPVFGNDGGYECAIAPGFRRGPAMLPAYCLQVAKLVPK